MTVKLVIVPVLPPVPAFVPWAVPVAVTLLRGGLLTVTVGILV